MNIRCELIDYEDREKAYDNPRLIVMDANFDQDMVRLRLGDEQVGYKTIKVSGEELIKAVQKCMHAIWPY